MDKRQTLTAEVKAHYARLADMESRDSFVAGTGGSPEAYYETLLNEVLAGIDQGRFDGFSSGGEIAEAVARDRTRWGISGARG